MVALKNESTKKEQTAFEVADYTFPPNGDPSWEYDKESDSESDYDSENDAFNVSCHGSDLKRMMGEANQCDKSTIKRRKVSTQLDLMNSNLISVSFDEKKPIAEDSFNSLGSGLCDEHPRNILKQRFQFQSKKEDQHLLPRDNNADMQSAKGMNKFLIEVAL